MNAPSKVPYTSLEPITAKEVHLDDLKVKKTTPFDREYEEFKQFKARKNQDRLQDPKPLTYDLELILSNRPSLSALS